MKDSEEQDPSETSEDEELLALLEEVATKKEELEKELEALKNQKLSRADDLFAILQPKLDEYIGEITDLIETETQDREISIEEKSAESESGLSALSMRVDEVFGGLSAIGRLQSEINSVVGRIASTKAEILKQVGASEKSSKEVAYRALTLVNELSSQHPEIQLAIQKVGERIDGLPPTYDDKDVWSELEALRKLILAHPKGGGNANRQINVKSSVMSLKYTDINFQNSTSIGWTASDDNTNKRVNISASVLLAGSGGGGSLTVKEADGSPTVASVLTIVVSNGTLTDDGGGQVTLSTGGGGSGITRVSSIITANTLAGASASTDYVFIAAAGMSFTLPDAGGGNNLYTLKNASGSSVLVTAVGGDTIDGSGSVLVAINNQALDFTSDGTNYQIV